MKRHVEIESNGNILRGYLELPDWAQQDAKAPLLIMLHGFSGDRCERHFILARLSRRLVAEGVATLRMDTAGSGESDGDFSQMTPLTRMQDCMAMIDYALGLPEIDSAKIMLLGYSNGGFVATNVAARRADDIQRLVLASASCRSHKVMEQVRRETGTARRGSLLVGDKFIEDGYGMDPLEAAARYAKPVTLIQGTADVSVTPDSAELYREAFPCCDVRFVEGADHSYDSPEFFSEFCDVVSDAVGAPWDGDDA